MLLTTQEEQVKRWEEHFPEIFKKDGNNIGSKQEMGIIVEEEEDNENGTEVKVDPPTKTEIQLALSQLKNAKAAGLDNIYWKY